MKIAIALVLLLSPWFVTVSAAATELSADKVSLVKLEPRGGSGGKAEGGGAGGDEQIELRKQEFYRFAKSKLAEMNRNHRLSRERMQITRNQDGSYRAVYHQINDASLAYDVDRSKSKSVPYVAVLSYKEEIYAASCQTPEACRRSEFATVGFIPNRHIFSYSNGSWK
jgi:hypothetical protein